MRLSSFPLSLGLADQHADRPGARGVSKVTIILTISDRRFTTVALVTYTIKIGRRTGPAAAERTAGGGAAHARHAGGRTRDGRLCLTWSVADNERYSCGDSR
jgi:hypothetical protein